VLNEASRPYKDGSREKEEFRDMAEQMQQLQRRVSEQVLEGAEAAPQWKQQFLKDPQTATSGIPEARQLQEMYESAGPTDQPPEATIPTAREEYLQLRRSLTEKILDKAASDPQWKQRLLDDRDAVLREANFPETQRLRALSQEEAEAQGHG
jgi:hypothetical protein